MGRLVRIAQRLTEVGGIVGVCLGASRASGTHHRGSDFDLGLSYRPPLDTDALRLLASELTGGPVEVTEPGGWGPWGDGGAWLTVAGHRVDGIYHDLDRVHRTWQESRAGRFEAGIQAGYPLGVCSHAYVGELAVGRVLADPGGELHALRQEARHCPRPLGEALIANAQWEVPFILSCAARERLAVTPSMSPAASSARSVCSCRHCTLTPVAGY